MRSRLLMLVLGLWGCATAAGTGTAALSTGTLDFGGRTRTYRYFEPAGAGPRPLVVALHGRGGQGKGQEKLSHLAEVAAREGFTVVFPDGVDRSWADSRGVTPASKQGVDDVGFLSALIDDFVAHHNADASRVYLTGMSNGGFMTLTYACAHPEKLAAAGSVTGGLDVGLQARCAGGLPVALVYGDEDPLVPFAGGAMKDDRGVIASGPDAARFFAAHNGCAAAPVTTALPDPAPDDGTTVERSDFCAGPGNEVSLWVVHGGGHAWPGGQAYLGERFVGRTSRSLDASEALWAFFKRHVRAAVGAQKT